MYLVVDDQSEKADCLKNFSFMFALTIALTLCCFFWLVVTNAKVNSYTRWTEIIITGFFIPLNVSRNIFYIFLRMFLKSHPTLEVLSDVWRWRQTVIVVVNNLKINGVLRIILNFCFDCKICRQDSGKKFSGNTFIDIFEMGITLRAWTSFLTQIITSFWASKGKNICKFSVKRAWKLHPEC